jgi:hypothetical protein
MQPPDTWDSFPLFQLLNDYLRKERESLANSSARTDLFSCTSANLDGGKFHNQLRDMFAPQVVRYVDLMESSIAQSIHKGFEKETWKPQGSVLLHLFSLACVLTFRSVPCSNGCATSEDMLWKLDVLQSFIRELHWPEEVFAEHLDHRLKLMAADMIEAAAKRSGFPQIHP